MNKLQSYVAALFGIDKEIDKLKADYEEERQLRALLAKEYQQKVVTILDLDEMVKVLKETNAALIKQAKKRHQDVEKVLGKSAS